MLDAPLRMPPKPESLPPMPAQRPLLEGEEASRPKGALRLTTYRCGAA